MIDEKTLKQIVSIALIMVLAFFVFLLVKPIFMPTLFGLVLAYIFFPIQKVLIKRFKNPTFTAFVTCTIVLLISLLFLWFLIPVLITQIFDSYVTIQSWDVTRLVQESFPFLFSSPNAATKFTVAYNNFIANSVSTSMESLTNIIVNLPMFLLKFCVVFIVFFYSLRDGEKLTNLLKKILPFSNSITSRFINKSREVTFSVVFGRVVIGIVTGALTGLGFYFTGVDNALLLTFVAILAAIIPIIGTWLVWIPVIIGLLIAGKTFTALVLFIYCGAFISLFLDNYLHAIIISKRASIPTSLTLIGLFGGIFAFGLFGIILGPLLVAYVITLFELYNEHNK